MEKTVRLGQFGKQLWTRERAREIREQVVATLEALGAGDALVIDARDVEVFDYSFANELFGRTLLSVPKDHPGRFVVVENLNDYTRLNLTKALEGMSLAMIERRGGILKLIGKVHPADQKTFETIARAGIPATAAGLSERLEVGLNAMNERLAKLVGLGLVRRERSTSPAGREHFEYSALS